MKTIGDGVMKKMGVKLSSKQVISIRSLIDEGLSQRAIAKYYNVGKSTIGDIASNHTWKDVILNQRKLLNEIIFDDNTIERFESQIVKNRSNKCWHWIGNKTFSYKHHGYTPSHIALKIYKDTYVPIDKVIVRSCNDSKCVNPDHLSMVKKADFIRANYHSSNPNSKLSESQVAIIKEELKRNVKSGILADKYNVHRNTINQIMVGNTYKCVGGVVEYDINYFVLRGKKLTRNQVREIRRLHEDENKSYTYLAILYGVSRITIRNIIQDRVWREMGE